MRVLGLDVGSTYIKATLIKGRNLEALELSETSYNPLEKCKNFIKKFKPDRVIATGYGRKLISEKLNKLGIIEITEIKAFAIGAKFIHPSVKTILDIGGQDTKVIRLDDSGRILKFEMNDKCSAGTGRFLEVMLKALGYDLSIINELPSDTNLKVKINSMCTVFAESEVISMIAQGIDRYEILKAIHYSISHRVVSMLKRISLEEDIIFAGGCACNKMIKGFIEKEVGKTLKIPKYPQFLGAIGAGLYGILNS